MERLFLVMVMLASCGAAPTDLLGKVFVFPKETKTDHVKLLTCTSSLDAVTVCLRFFTDLTRSYALFSLATPKRYNSFMLLKLNRKDVIRVHVRDGSTDFLSLSFPPNSWHSMCATWNSQNGMVQLWVDGKQTVKRFIQSGQPISGEFITILGQEQDTYGGGFDASQSFIGMISRLHVWDYVLSAAEIRRYVEDANFSPGNVLNWRSLDYEIVGSVLVEEEIL
uniref:C-reactive protein-like n=1 Tax=Doryrhamphus excisus TaxID=161450 RepID=UPI0025AE6AB6|nr:C-reactive protein-like [Doryrhamphus excisus]